MSKISSDSTIFEVCKIIDKEIKTDFGGGSPIEKTFLMAYLVQNQNLKSFVEIGVYNGKSLFPIAYSICKNQGKSYGVDSDDLFFVNKKGVKKNYNSKFLNFEKMHENTIQYKNECGFGKSIRLIRKDSEKNIKYFKKNKIELDIVHINGINNSGNVKQDYEPYYKILKSGGFLILDDISQAGVRDFYKQTKKQCIEVFICNTFSILLKQPKTTLTIIKTEKLNKRLTEVYTKTVDLLLKPIKIPNVSVGILTYNHVDYIEKCINSVVKQTGNFNLNIFICDDCSTDGTSEKIQKIINKISNKSIKINHVKNKINIGIIPNLKQLVTLLKNSDYFTFCEGDDYYLSSTRIEQHLQYHIKKPETILSFNKLLMYFQNENKYEVFEPNIRDTILNTENLILENYIGNFSACFYDSRIFNYIKDDLFDIYTVDWMFNIFSSQYGDIGQIDEPLNVYRKHNSGVWCGINNTIKIQKIIGHINQYNKYLNFSYDEAFTYYRNKCVSELNDQWVEQQDIAIIDDVFPHQLSGFRYQEFSSILESFKKSTVFTTGKSLPSLGNKNGEEIIIEYKRKKPKLSERVQKIYDFNKFKYKIIYCNFLNNAYLNVLPIAEKYKIPFVFTLYPGAGFGLNNTNSDLMLKQVLDSPCFKKVIVTQTITYDYLIKNKFCPKNKIEFIYGVVVPLNKLNQRINTKKYYGFQKKILDICFVAHRYTEHGEDKGYDIFIEVVKKISKNHNNIKFHVVGSFDRNILDVTGVNNITFYGTKEQDWFDRFYADKDIIISPNIDSKIFKGSFDGFPTGCCTDAAMRKVVMFCTDPLHLNFKFKNDIDIVIVEHNADEIIKKIEYYIDNPKKLKIYQKMVIKK